MLAKPGLIGSARARSDRVPRGAFTSVQFEINSPSRAGSARPTALMSSRRLRSGHARRHQELPPPALPPLQLREAEDGSRVKT